MAGERKSDSFCRSVIDRDSPSVVAIRWRTRPGEEDYATEVDVKSPGTAKTLRIMLYTQTWGRLPRVGLGLVPGLLASTSVEPVEVKV